MSYRYGIEYLESHTKVLELCNQFGARVAICPDWNGRVMTSTCDGQDGISFGLINVHAIDHHLSDHAGIFCGGEDQLTFSPEGGPFSLYYATPHDGSVRRGDLKENFAVPVGYRDAPFVIDVAPPATKVRLRRSIQMRNLAGALFDFDVVRTIRLLDISDVRYIFGGVIAIALEQSDVSYVGFETANTIFNRGPVLSKTSGLVSFRMRGMFNSGSSTIAVVPFRAGELHELGPSVCAEFFGHSPHHRLRVTPQAALLRADSKGRCRIGVARKRALPFLGAVDFREGTLTIVSFNMPPEPWQHDYLCNDYCEMTDNAVPDFVSSREHYLKKSVSPAAKPKPTLRTVLELDPDETPYSGEVVRAYNHGPSTTGEELRERFYEFGVFSPAKVIGHGESLTHHQYTLHINADNTTLAHLLPAIFNVSFDFVYDVMLK